MNRMQRPTKPRKASFELLREGNYCPRILSDFRHRVQSPKSSLAMIPDNATDGLRKSFQGWCTREILTWTSSVLRAARTSGTSRVIRMVARLAFFPKRPSSLAAP